MKTFNSNIIFDQRYSFVCLILDSGPKAIMYHLLRANGSRLTSQFLKMSCLVKFSFSEEATKTCAICHMVLIKFCGLNFSTLLMAQTGYEEEIWYLQYARHYNPPLISNRSGV